MVGGKLTLNILFPEICNHASKYHFCWAGCIVTGILGYAICIVYGDQNSNCAITFVNIIGGILIGTVANYATRKMAFVKWMLLFATGICCGLTTFSTFRLNVCSCNSKIVLNLFILRL